MMLNTLALILAAIPAALFAVNLTAFRRPRRPSRKNPTASEPAATPAVSVLVPARNEEDAIVPALDAILANPSPDLDVVVLDDHSTDRTAGKVRALAARDPRVRLIEGRPLPEGWCGKQHACWQLALAARHDLLLFVDADVRLAPDAVASLAGHLDRLPGVHLLSGVPRQVTGTFLERLLIPLIHFILLGFLPLPAARRARSPAFAAGCGQLFLARREAYFAAGGHRAIRDSLHDGLRLPRAFRSAGFATDLADVTLLASCRMYQSGREVWRGLGKNATEGLAKPTAILPWSFLLLGGHVLPWVLLAWATLSNNTAPDLVSPIALACALGPVVRLVAALRFRQSLLGALLHPLGIAALVAIQWQALARHWLGRPMEWRGRAYPSVRGASAPTAIP